MECNKDEAARAKYIAERKFSTKDITGAKKFALKAQNLYPELDGISQLLATLEIYIYSENKINGEADWYGMLGVSPQDDVDVIRKQYRKLALMLHPDKNKAKGADGAFNLISQAWNLLSDKSKRSAYDKLLHIQPQCDGSSLPPGQNGFYNFARGSNMEAPKDKSNTVPSASHKQKPAPVPSDKEKPPSGSASHKHESTKVPPSSHKQKPPNVPVKSNKRKRVPTAPDPPQEPNETTFWTACHGCKMQYEYPRMYINRNLLCPNCREPFFSFEIAPPPPAKRETSVRHQKVHKSNISGINSTAGPNTKLGRSGDSVNHDKFQWAPFSKTAGAASAAQAASMVQHAYEKAKREREEANIATKRDEALRKKKFPSGIVGNSVSDGKSDEERRINIDDLGIDGKTSKQVKVCKSMKSSMCRDVSDVQCLHLLTKKAKKEICKRIYEWNSAAATKSVDANVTLSEKADEKKNGKTNPVINGGRKSNDSQTLQSFDENHTSKYTLDALYVNINKIPMSVEVPDSDFHNFGKYRSENCLEENQVWAAYDNNDGMPRYYGMVDRVFCLNPFKVRINWLNFKTNNQLGALSCIGSDYSKSCGDFSLGKQEIIDSVSYFSHKVKWTKGSGGCVRIYPRAGDVWCVYKNWCPEWNELTAYEVVHEYNIVQVLEDNDNNEEGGGVAVIPLVKVVGFKTVFRPHLDPKKIHKIPKEEYFRFSHHIPSYLIKGREDLRGCLELDPAATPPQFLHVIAGYDLFDAEIMEREEES